MEEMFIIDTYQISQIERIQLLGFQAVKNRDGDLIPYENKIYEGSQQHVSLHKQYSQNQMQNVGTDVDLNKKFDIQTF
jgi:hypothetical protein